MKTLYEPIRWNKYSGSPELFFTCEKFNFPSLLSESRANAVGPMMSAI
jgi:hypothetical protein